MSERMRVDIWSDVVCPWCYVGKARFEAALADFPRRDKVDVVHHSFELDPSSGAPEPVLDMLASKYGVSPAQAAAMDKGVADQAADAGLAYTSERLTGNTFDTHRLLHWAAAQGRQVELLDRLYRAHFAEGHPVFTATDLVPLAADAGLDADEAAAVLADRDAYAAEVRKDIDQARAYGATGVPFFVIDDTYGISGAQPTAVFAQALDQAWREGHPLISVPGAPEGMVCTDEGCAIPEK